MASRLPVGSVVTPMPATSRWHQGPQAVQRSPHLSEVPTPPRGPHTSPKSPSLPKAPRLSHFLSFHTVTGKDKHCLLAKDTSGHFGRTPLLLSPAPARAPSPPWGSRDEASSGQPQRPRGTDNVSVPQNTQRRSCKSTRDTLGLPNPKKTSAALAAPHGERSCGTPSVSKGCTLPRASTGRGHSPEQCPLLSHLSLPSSIPWGQGGDRPLVPIGAPPAQPLHSLLSRSPNGTQEGWG